MKVCWEMELLKPITMENLCNPLSVLSRFESAVCWRGRGEERELKEGQKLFANDIKMRQFCENRATGRLSRHHVWKERGREDGGMHSGSIEGRLRALRMSEWTERLRTVKRDSFVVLQVLRLYKQPWIEIVVCIPSSKLLFLVLFSVSGSVVLGGIKKLSGGWHSSFSFLFCSICFL